MPTRNALFIFDKELHVSRGAGLFDTCDEIAGSLNPPTPGKKHRDDATSRWDWRLPGSEGSG
jgi:hypothetical protein